MEKIVIVGGGHVGLTLAYDLHQRKKETKLDPHIVLLRGKAHPFLKTEKDQKVVLENIITGEQSTDIFPFSNVHLLGDDLSPILKECRLIIIAVPDIMMLRGKILNWIKSNVTARNPVIAFVRGGQGGLIYLLDQHRKDDILRNASFLLVEDSFYGTRFINNKIEFKRKKKTNVALAGPNQEDALALLKRPFTGPSVGADWHHFVPVRPLDLQFDALGYIIHLGVALDDKNIERTRRGDQYLHYCEGVHGGNAEKLEALDKERVALAKSYGANNRLFTSMLKEQYGLPLKPTFLETLKGTKSIYRSRAAASMKDLKEGRVLQEDIPALLTIGWLAEKTGIDLPVTRAHTNDVLKKVDVLGLDLEALSGYRKYLEKISLEKSDLLVLLGGESK